MITDHEFGERARDNHGEFSTHDRFFLSLFIFIFLQFKFRHDKTTNGVTWETDLETFLVEVWLIAAVHWIAKWPVSPLKSFSWPKFIIILNPSSQLISEHLCSLSYFLIAYVKQSKWISSECSLYYSELLNSISRVRNTEKALGNVHIIPKSFCWIELLDFCDVAKLRHADLQSKSHVSGKIAFRIGTKSSRGVLGLIFAGYVPLASQSTYSILAYSVANYRPHPSHFWGKYLIFAISTWSLSIFLWIDQFLRLNEAYFTFYVQYKHGTFANRKYE